jgi:hypothetical protein
MPHGLVAHQCRMVSLLNQSIIKCNRMRAYHVNHQVDPPQGNVALICWLIYGNHTSSFWYITYAGTISTCRHYQMRKKLRYRHKTSSRPMHMLQKLYVTSGFLPGALVGNEKSRIFPGKDTAENKRVKGYSCGIILDFYSRHLSRFTISTWICLHQCLLHSESSWHWPTPSPCSRDLKPSCKIDHNPICRTHGLSICYSLCNKLYMCVRFLPTVQSTMRRRSATQWLHRWAAGEIVDEARRNE